MNDEHQIQCEEEGEKKKEDGIMEEAASNCICNILFLKLHAMYIDICYVIYTFYIVLNLLH